MGKLKLFQQVLASFSKFQQVLASFSKVLASFSSFLKQKADAKTCLLLKPVLKLVLKPWVLKLLRHYAKTSFCASFSQLLLKPVLKPWVLKLFKHDAKTSFSASFSQLLLKPVLKPWELKLFLIFRFTKDILASFSIKFCFINSFSSVAPAKVC